MIKLIEYLLNAYIDRSVQRYGVSSNRFIKVILVRMKTLEKYHVLGPPASHAAVVDDQ